MKTLIKFSLFFCKTVLCLLLVHSVESRGTPQRKEAAKTAKKQPAQVSDARQSDNPVSLLQKIMQGYGAARITQYMGDGSQQNTKEEGTLYWSGAKKCVRVEMDNGVIYLYTTGGMHMKEPHKNWAHVPLPNDWVYMLLEPRKIIEEKQAKVESIDAGTYGLFLEEGGRFIQLFWTQAHVKGWIIGVFEQGVPFNETVVELTPIQAKKLPDSAWAPESSFLDIN